jgi:SAM-dependent methyltransferase
MQNAIPEESVKNTYKELYYLYGKSPRSLGWDKGKQFLRFHQLTSLWKLDDSSILDVGCGFGDFIHYLKIRGVERFRYQGIDLVDEFLGAANTAHFDADIAFRRGDLLSLPFDEEFDYALASGTFNLKMEGVDGYDYIQANLRKMFELSRVAIAVDFLTDRVDYKHPHNFNSSPEKILSIAYGLSRRVVLRNDYFPFEFSIVIFKDDSFRKENTLFSSVESELAEWIN